MGGLEGDPIDMAEHDAEPWQKMVTAIRSALGDDPKRLMLVDELRRAIEDLDERQYNLPYFERWAEAMVNLMEEKDLLTRDEVTARMDEIRGRVKGAA
jgi:thiocyanate hydrolase subunit beta